MLDNISSKMVYILNNPAIFGLQLNVLDIYRLSIDIFEKDFLGVRWATSKDLVDETYTKYAAKVGSLDCLTYLHENGCSWTELTCSAAAENGHPPASCRLIV